MNNKIKWIEHEEKKILYLDFSNSSEEESTSIWNDAESDILNYNGELPLLVLVNVENVKYNNATQNAYRQVRDKSKNVKQKWVVVGASTSIKVMIKILCIFVKDDIVFTDSVDAAKDLLVIN